MRDCRLTLQPQLLRWKPSLKNRTTLKIGSKGIIYGLSGFQRAVSKEIPCHSSSKFYRGSRTWPCPVGLEIDRPHKIGLEDRARAQILNIPHQQDTSLPDFSDSRTETASRRPYARWVKLPGRSIV